MSHTQLYILTTLSAYSTALPYIALFTPLSAYTVIPHTALSTPLSAICIPQTALSTPLCFPHYSAPCSNHPTFRINHSSAHGFTHIATPYPSSARYCTTASSDPLLFHTAFRILHFNTSFSLLSTPFRIPLSTSFQTSFHTALYEH
jgi:hypothetical protein